jgi:hypothetical protein
MSCTTLLPRETGSEPPRLHKVISDSGDWLDDRASKSAINDFKTIPTSTSFTTSMASRRLALNLTQGLRNRAALNAVSPLKRGFATPVIKNGVKTESTTLSNGLTVRVELG